MRDSKNGLRLHQVLLSVEDVERSLVPNPQKRGVRFSEKPKDSWGEREARFTNPDGYHLAISSPANQPHKKTQQKKILQVKSVHKTLL